ncbi:alpha-amylase family glycosyl hydrolase [Tahibacter caeni]|uniref:alpha-amylase family glycosyl hydrolase n=1 Tax=Tahibacter caeni TaxID=1453545 RepID=UPI002148E160|nr:alpha-amylase family glycosyl hydrolase [Tahibacter caeni]
MSGSPALAACGERADAGRALRHVPSPDWRAQVVYFAVIDRFDDGDVSNSDQGAGEFDPADPAKYSGGDLCGLTRRLDYLRELGATALWITPPVAHQWWNARVHYGGYHGYWGQDFRKVDAHFGTLADYRALATQLHARGMYLVQDIVVNHVGDYFQYDGAWDIAHPERGYAPNAGSRPTARPTQWPFSRNDARRARDRRLGAYHWTPEIADFDDATQVRDFQLAGLDDLNTENPRVRTALRKSYGDWIREVGVDAFRIDTAFYVPPDFFRDFLYADERAAPGVLRVAAETGRERFHVFGEGFGLDRPFEDTQARRIDGYVGDADGPLLPGMLDFPLYASALDAFARGRATAELGWRIRSLAQRRGDPHLQPRFIDNHDVDRFLAGGSEAGLRQSLLMLFTLPGIPVVYYGTEQGFTVQRAAMFARGVDSGGRGHFDTNAPLYRYLRDVIALRRGNAVLWRGLPTVVFENAAGAGGIAYRMDDGDEHAVIAMNTADASSLLDAIDTGLPAGTRLRGVFGIHGVPPDLVVGADGRITLALPARAGNVWRVDGSAASPSHAAPPPEIAPPGGDAAGDALALHGIARSGTPFALVVDGDLAHATRVTPARDGTWRAQVDTAHLAEGNHRVLAWDAENGSVSAARTFRIARAWETVLDIDDAAGDDHGPDGRYRYPTDASWRGVHPLDLRRVRVARAGEALRIEATMGDLLAAWNPPNGFDHLALTVFVQLAGRTDGERVMPLQFAELPDGMRWHYRLRVNGWSGAWFGSDDADAMREGTPLSSSPAVQADRARHTLSLTIPANLFGASLSGARLYLATWDYDGGYRPLAPDAASFGFGGAAADAPRVMDDSAVLQLPRWR